MGARFGLAHHTDPRSTVTTPVYFFGFRTWNTPLRALVFLCISPLFLSFNFQPQTPNLLPLPLHAGQYLATPVKAPEDICLSVRALPSATCKFTEYSPWAWIEYSSGTFDWTYFSGEYLKHTALYNKPQR